MCFGAVVWEEMVIHGISAISTYRLDLLHGDIGHLADYRSTGELI